MARRSEGNGEGQLVLHLPAAQASCLAPESDNRQHLQRLLKHYSGISWQLQVAIDDHDSQANRSQRYRMAEEHPTVRDILRRFDAEIISREPSPREQFLASRDTRDT